MPSDLLIREAELADAEALFEAHKDSVENLCAGAYSEAHLAVWFEGRSPEIYRPAIEAHQIWLAEQHGRVLGFVGFVPGEVTVLFVRKEAAGLGLGKRLFALGVEKAESGFPGPLTVVATQNSQRFYQDHGFLPVEEQTFVRGKPELHFKVVRMQRVSAAESNVMRVEHRNPTPNPSIEGDVQGLAPLAAPHVKRWASSSPLRR